MSVVDITSRGANPNIPDNTDIIQHVIDSVSPGDTVYVPKANFYVDALRSLWLRSGTNLKIDGALCANPTNVWESVVVNLSGVSQVTVTGPGAIVGERYRNTAPPPGRHGLCLQVLNSETVTIGGGLVLKEGQADGLYVQDSKNITVDGVICSDNARNGMSIISVETMHVKNSTFTLTHSESPMPQAGIDIEPDIPSQSLLNIYITGNNFIKNKGAGVYIAFEPAANRGQVHVINNFFVQHYKDGSGPCIGGRNSVLANLLYATCRWIPGYDWWAYPTQFET